MEFYRSFCFALFLLKYGLCLEQNCLNYCQCDRVYSRVKCDVVVPNMPDSLKMRIMELDLSSSSVDYKQATVIAQTFSSKHLI